MLTSRKRAKDYIKSIRTVRELEEMLNSLVLKDEERQIASDVFAKGLTHTQVAFKYHISIEKSHKVIQNVLDRVLQ